MARLAFWYDFASTYSYLTAMRIEALARAARVELDWRPFLLGPILARQGWNDSPFNLYPAKGRYMWRDVERIAAGQGLPFRRPSVFPRSGLWAARVALTAAAEGWIAPFTRAVFAANFAEDRDIADPEVLKALLRALGRDGEATVRAAAAVEVKTALREQTESAAAAGLFGAPSFVIGEEIFWGNDRLEPALAHAAALRTA